MQFKKTQESNENAENIQAEWLKANQTEIYVPQALTKIIEVSKQIKRLS